MQGFIVTDYISEFDDARRNMADWVSKGQLKFKEDVRPGLEKAPEHLLSLFEGSNRGKLIVKVGDRLTADTPRSRL